MLALTVLLALAPLLTSARYFITEPNGNTTWNIGNPATVVWQYRVGGPIAQKFTVDLIAGPDSNSKWVDTVCDEVPAVATSCTWDRVPTYLPTLKTGYSLRMRIHTGNASEFLYEYGVRFQIAGTRNAQDGEQPRKPAPTVCIGNCDNTPKAKSSSNSATGIPTTSTLLLASLGWLLCAMV